MNGTVSFEFTHKITSIQKSLYGFILSLVPNRSEAEDILQETNLILCQKSEEYDPNGHFQGWAFKIARFQVMKHQTNRKRSKIYFSTEIIEDVAAEEFDKKKVLVVQKALSICYEELPQKMQIIAKLRFKKDKSLKYISAKVNRPMGAISSTLYRIRQKLLECVNEKVVIVESEMDFKKS